MFKIIFVDRFIMVEKLELYYGLVFNVNIILEMNFIVSYLKLLLKIFYN